MCEAFSFGATIVEVKVDPETGQVEVIEATAAQDVGFALNPLVLEGQFEGSIAMGGQGGMLTEYHEWYEGRCVNPTMLDYKVPLACDMPKINNIIVASIDPFGPLRRQGKPACPLPCPQPKGTAPPSAMPSASIWIRFH